MARIGTWNLEDLFTVEGAFGPATPEEYEAKISAITATIRALGVDVLAVQEVGSPDAIDDVAARLGAPWHRALADPDGRGIRVGFLARVPLREPEQFRSLAPGLPDVVVDDEGTVARELARPGLRVTAELDGVDVVLLTVHFKSRRRGFPQGDEPDDEDQRARYGAYALARRSAEATTTRILANRLLGGAGSTRPLVVLGDLNDTEHAATTRILEGPGADGGWRLWNVGAAIPAERRHSHGEGERRELIDHVLVSHALVDGLGAVAVHDAGGASDHRPLTADLAPALARAGAVSVRWRAPVGDDEVVALGAGAGPGWWDRVRPHSLGWAAARADDGGGLVGFVNVAWDGVDHAFLLDATVAADHRHRGVATTLVAVATRHARRAGCSWLHVDFEEHLAPFYLRACGFSPTAAGLIRLW